MNTVLVTGATGNLGKAIVWSLLRRGIGVRLATRTPEQVTPIAGVHAVWFSYEEPSSVRSGLNGVDAAILMAPPLDIRTPALLNPVIDLAVERQIEHLILVSTLGIDSDENAPLRIVERHLMKSGVPYTIVRPNFFMENFATGYLAQSILNGGFSLPAAEGRTSYISVADVAEVIETALVAELRNREFNLTGPTALGSDEIAELFSVALDRQIIYTPIADEDLARMYESMGMPFPMLHYASLFYQASRNGIAARITQDVEEVLGRLPFPFEFFIRVNIEKWR